MALQALGKGSSARSALTQVIQVLEEQLADLSTQMKTMVKSLAPTLLERLGVRPVVASVILSEVGNIGRFTNEGQFASYCGAAQSAYLRKNREYYGKTFLKYGFSSFAPASCKCLLASSRKSISLAAWRRPS